jgi:mannose/cellobiose epimerase-like protein (N-acyl-D-glucosamine 2-epimerase family)
LFSTCILNGLIIVFGGDTMNKETTNIPDFLNPNWLRKHIFDILHFYYPRCIDYTNGGYFNCFLDDGTICDYQIKHLIGTCRFIYNFSIGSMLSGSSWCFDAAVHGLKFLKEHHLDKVNGGYFWILKGQKVTNSTKFAYGHAFVLLAVSTAYRAGIPWAATLIEYLYNILELHFWEPEYELYKDEINSDWSIISPYRGQNANMHLCEAMMAAYEATLDRKYLKRAYQLAKSVTLKLASQSGGMIWEHYYPNWEINWNYKESGNEFRPIGFIPGHSIEWSKLLLLLENSHPKAWMLPRAKELYHEALERGRDSEYDGLYYSLSPEGKVTDTDKYYWVIAETIGASALMAMRTAEQQYWYNYQSIFTYAWTYFVDKRYGGWYQLLNRQNQKYNNIKSPPPKTDYHPITNCYEAIRGFSQYPVF